MKSYLILIFLVFGIAAPTIGQSSYYIEYVTDVVHGQQSFFDSGGQPQTPSTYVHTTCTPNSFVGGTSYDIQVSTSVDFTTGVITQSGTSTGSFLFQYLCPETSYYTRTKLSSESTYGIVKEFYSGDMSATKANKIRFSSGGSLVYETINTSTIPTVGTDISIRVDPQANANNYTIQISKDNTFSTGVISKSASTHDNWGLLYFAGLDMSSQYYVRATYEGGDCNLSVGNTLWGRITSFNTIGSLNGPMGAPELKAINPLAWATPCANQTYEFNFFVSGYNDGFSNVDCYNVEWTFSGAESAYIQGQFSPYWDFTDNTIKYTTSGRSVSQIDPSLTILDPYTSYSISPSDFGNIDVLDNNGDPHTVAYAESFNGIIDLGFGNVAQGHLEFIGSTCGTNNGNLQDRLDFDDLCDVEYTSLNGDAFLCVNTSKTYWLSDNSLISANDFSGITWTLSNPTGWATQLNLPWAIKLTPGPTAQNTLLIATIDRFNGTSDYPLQKSISIRQTPDVPIFDNSTIFGYPKCDRGQYSQTTVSILNDPNASSSNWHEWQIDGNILIDGQTGIVPIYGSNSVDLDFNDTQHNQPTLQVRANENSCTSDWQSVIISLEHVPLAPQNLRSGEGASCAGLYSPGLEILCDDLWNADEYVWSDNTLGYNFVNPITTSSQNLIVNSGVLNSTDVSVYARNVCGSGPFQSFTLNTNATPTIVPTINSPTHICRGENATFSINNPEAGVRYTWIINNMVGGTLEHSQTFVQKSGENLTEIEIYFDNTPPSSFDIEIIASNCSMGSQITSGIITQSPTYNPSNANCPVSNQRNANNNYSKQDVQLTSEIKISPNPSNTGHFNLELSGFQEVKKIVVLDICGAIVFETSTVEDLAKIDLSALNKSIYFVQVIDGVHSKTQKIIFQ